MRGHAAEALGKIGDPRAIDPLITALKDAKNYVRKNAAEALEEIFSRQRDVTPLIAAQEDSGNNWRQGGGRNFIG